MQYNTLFLPPFSGGEEENVVVVVVVVAFAPFLLLLLLCGCNIIATAAVVANAAYGATPLTKGGEDEKGENADLTSSSLCPLFPSPPLLIPIPFLPLSILPLPPPSALAVGEGREGGIWVRERRGRGEASRTYSIHTQTFA